MILDGMGCMYTVLTAHFIVIGIDGPVKRNHSTQLPLVEKEAWIRYNLTLDIVMKVLAGFPF